MRCMCCSTTATAIRRSPTPAVLRAGPLEESVGWDDTPPLLERLSKAPGCLNRLSPGVNVLECLLTIGHPKVHKAPLRRQYFAVLEATPNDPVGICGCDVVAWLVEVMRDATGTTSSAAKILASR